MTLAERLRRAQDKWPNKDLPRYMWHKLRGHPDMLVMKTLGINSGAFVCTCGQWRVAWSS